MPHRIHDSACHVLVRDIPINWLSQVCDPIQWKSRLVDELGFPKEAKFSLHQKQPQDKKDHQHTVEA